MKRFHKILYHFGSFLIRYKRQFVVFSLLTVGLGVLESLQPIFYKQFIEVLPKGQWSLVVSVLVLYGMVRFGQLVTDLLTYIIGDMVLIPAARDARLAVFRKIQDLDFAFHLNKSSGSLISAIKRGDGAFFNLFHNFNNQLRIFINLLVILISFWFLSWWVSGLMFVSIIINLILIYFLVKYNILTRRLFNKKEDDVSAIIVDNLLNYETVKLFAQEDYEYKRLKEVFRPWLKSLWRYANSFRLIDASLGMIGNTLMLGLSVWGAQAVFGQRISPGDFIMMLGFISSFYWRFFDLVYKLRDTAKNYSDLEDYFSLLDEPILVKDPQKPVKLAQVKGEIVFDHVWFVYEENKQSALQDFDLQIRQGQTVALVGRSGAGKTTVIKLLLRFFDIQKGRIMIDGVDIRQMKKSDLRSLFGIVPQEPILFNNTLKFNIAYGRPGAGEAEIIAAAKMAHAWEFIKNMPRGLDTMVGERGVKLSGGQRQRIAIARVILKNPKIIVFDEATSALDTESERLIQKAFWRVAKGKTTIVIAHRLSTIVRVDKIVVIDDGRVMEVGSHRELVYKRDGLYRKLWQMQTGLIE
ncbi:MAG: ABC transporter ATP-binding protein [bacterium]|nr:ABC transporter ATP-binding protein [bacterium]